MEDSPVIEPIEEVVAVLVFDSPELALERDTKEFTKEEDEFDKTFELPEFEKPSRPPIELKLLPFGLRYAFFNSNLVSPIVISNKLSEEDVTRLIVVLEKHQPVFGYALRDLKGISPALCTHQIHVNLEIISSREPQ